MKKYTIEIEVEAISSGAAQDWAIRQLMGEVGYVDMGTMTVYDENGNDVTDEEDIHPYFSEEKLKEQAEIAEFQRIYDVNPFCI